MFDCSKCLKDCKASCCSIVPIEMDIFEENRHKMVSEPIREEEVVMLSPFTGKNEALIIAITKDNTCCFLKEDLSCAIYENRPIVCRHFGGESHSMMSCVYQDKNGRIRSRQEKRALERIQAKLQNKAIKSK